MLSEAFVDALSVPQRLVYACACAGLIGVAASARNNLGESVMGDIIDADQARASLPLLSPLYLTSPLTSLPLL